MAFFRKKREEEISGSEEMSQLPELPPLPELPSLPEFPSISQGEEEIQKFPSFPKSSYSERFGQEAIKQAVGEESGEEGEEKISSIPQFKSQFPKPMMPLTREEINIKRPEIPRTLEISRPVSFEERTRKAEPLFVRIDKFEEALESFEEVKKKIREIEKLLQNVREIKAKEEEDLSEWERELETIKARIDSINREVFEKV